MKYDVFISYSRHDLDKVKEIKDILEQKAHLTCWMDVKGIESGSQFEDVIISAMDESQVVLFCMSESSMNSKWTKDEVRYAYEVGKKVIPVNIDGCKPSGWFLFKFSGRDSIDFNDKNQIDKLLDDLKRWTRKEYTEVIAEESKNQESISKENVTKEVNPSESMTTKNNPEMSSDKNQTEQMLEKYTHFKPRKRWKLPLFPFIVILISSYPTLAFGVLFVGSVLNGLNYEVHVDDSQYYNYETETYTDTVMYEARCEGCTGLIYGSAYSMESEDEARELALKGFWKDWRKMFFGFGGGFLAICFLYYLIYRFFFPQKRHGYISDFADTIEEYENTGFGKSYRFYIKDGKYGLVEVTHYQKVTDPIFDEVEWKKEHTIYSAKMHGETKLYDVRFGEMK